jgi:hypothetical protein
VCAAVRRALHHVRAACGTRRHRRVDGQRHLERHAGEAGADDAEQFRPVDERQAHLVGERDGAGSKPAYGDEDRACGRARALHAVQLAHQRDADHIAAPMLHLHHGRLSVPNEHQIHATIGAASGVEMAAASAQVSPISRTASRGVTWSYGQIEPDAKSSSHIE